MQSLSAETNQNNSPSYNYQCDFNYSGCKFTSINKPEMIQHYKVETYRHLLYIQDKIRHIENTNYEIRKDYHKLFKIISNIQQFKKFPDILPKPSKEKNNDDNEMNKNKKKVKEKDKKEILNNFNNFNIQNIQNKIISEFNNKQKIYEVIGNKRKRSDEEKYIPEKKLEEPVDKNEEIILSSIDDDNNDNNFIHEEEAKHKIFINKSDEENQNQNKKEENLINNKKKKEDNYQNINRVINKEKSSSKNKKVNFIIQKENNEEMNDEQIKRFLSETEKNSKYNYDLLKKEFIEIYKKSPEAPKPIIYQKPINEKEKLNLKFVCQREKEKEIINDIEKTPFKMLDINNEAKDQKFLPVKDIDKFEIISDTENNGNKNNNNNEKVFIYGNDEISCDLLKEENINKSQNNSNSNNSNNNKIEVKEPEINLDKNKQKNNKGIISKIDYNDNILNNKKVQWEATLKKITGWFAIGVSENYDSNSENNINFLLSNQNIISNVTDNKKVKINLNLKEGDNLICLYSHKFKHLKIKKGEEEFVIENIISQSGRPLVPTAFFEKDCDQIIFHNFRVLAEYKK